MTNIPQYTLAYNVYKFAIILISFYFNGNDHVFHSDLILFSYQYRVPHLCFLLEIFQLQTFLGNLVQILNLRMMGRFLYKNLHLSQRMMEFEARHSSDKNVCCSKFKLAFYLVWFKILVALASNGYSRFWNWFSIYV